MKPWTNKQGISCLRFLKNGSPQLGKIMCKFIRFKLARELQVENVLREILEEVV